MRSPGRTSDRSPYPCRLTAISCDRPRRGAGHSGHASETRARFFMTDEEHSSRFLPLMLVLFVGSGCAALIYQIVWFQVLQLVIGSSAVSLAVLLGTFMGGMCAGSLLLAKYVSQVRRPLGVYAWLEGLTGVCGAALIVLMPLVSRLYTAVDGGGQASVALRAIVCVLLLLPPTVLVGATLPA